MNKKQRDQIILNLLSKFRICSRDQIARLIFHDNSNPINVCNRVLKRLASEGHIKAIPRRKDQCYIYTLAGSRLSPHSTNINHHLKIVDYFIQEQCPKQIIIEPKLGTYEPDIFYKNDCQNSVCVEIQLTQISEKKMNEKINQFVSEYGKNHDAKILYICSSFWTKNLIKNGLKINSKPLPKSI